MIEYRTITQIAGPLVFVEKTHKVGYGELVEIEMQDGNKKAGQVIDTSDNIVVIQVFEGTSNIDRKSIVRFSGKTIRLNCNPDMLGRVLDSMGKPLDGGADIVPEKQLDVNGSAMNPYSRDVPSRFLQTGISSIDGMNTLTVGQKLPIFSISGLPHNEIALQVARQAKISKNTAVVFAAIGITNEEARQFIEEFEKTGALERSVIFLNLANNPAIERLITPRSALTAAEYLAFEKGYDVLVILTDMTSYAEALREIGAAREEVPGRRGYPGYMYTDLANIFERAGIIKGKKGSITQFSIITMPSGDITHPVPDLTGYITEGQIVLSKELHSKGIYPPIDVLPSLSRLMQKGASKENTRDDHRAVSNQMYAAYAEGRSLRSLAAIVGKEALTERDRLYLKFADEFENNFVRQGKYEDRDIQQSLNLGWKLLTTLPKNELTKIDDSLIKAYEEKLGLKFAELGGS